MATQYGDKEAPIKDLSKSTDVRSTFQLAFSQTLAQYVTSIPSAFNFRATGYALLGFFFGDRFQSMGALQASVGFATGGKIGVKDFSLLPNITALAQSAGTLPLVKAEAAAADNGTYPLASPVCAFFTSRLHVVSHIIEL